MAPGVAVIHRQAHQLASHHNRFWLPTDGAAPALLGRYGVVLLNRHAEVPLQLVSLIRLFPNSAVNLLGTVRVGFRVLSIYTLRDGSLPDKVIGSKRLFFVGHEQLVFRAWAITDVGYELEEVIQPNIDNGMPLAMTTDMGP